MACSKPQEKSVAKDLDIAYDSGCANRVDGKSVRDGVRARAHHSTAKALRPQAKRFSGDQF